MKLIAATLAASTFALLLALPLAAADKPNPDTHKAPAVRSVWPAESISGSITMVQPDHRLLVVQDADGVPYDLTITPRTRIVNGGQKVTLDQLAGDQNKNVSVKFLPERRGDVAETIRIGG
jgi:hypothetical protein